jgi:hypothetical protein
MNKLINTQYGNYVKFIRSTEANWKRIEDTQKNSDTLYFVSDTGSASGKLYLGAKLISNGSLTSATSLSQLNDVLIAEGITDQSILVYNASEERWENKSILDIFLSINEVFKGATENNDGIAGLVPAPKVGQQNLFLRGDASWANPVEGVMEIIDGIETQLTTIIGNDINSSIREIASDEAASAVASIVADAPEQFDTLKEIATWIQNNQDVADITNLSQKVTNLEDVIYGKPANEETGSPEIIGLQTVISTLQVEVASHEEDIEDIKAALRWQDII